MTYRVMCMGEIDKPRRLGRLTDIDTARNAATIQDNAYAWRSDGSLERRTADAAGAASARSLSTTTT